MINYSICIMGTKPGTKKADITETKAYGTSQCTEVIDIHKFAKHISDHGSVYSRGDVVGLLTQAVDCLREMMLDGKKVRLGDLGDFYPELATEGADTTDEFNAQKIKEVNVIWIPGKSFKNLRAEAEFQLVPSRKAQADAIEVIRNEETIQGLE
ncbi:MAG: DNA-binding protein [Bacteroidaceae bacterium]|nr:DNA-binding protein [Bacteroidaceae bacterium]